MVKERNKEFMSYVILPLILPFAFCLLPFNEAEG
jgi:hypothetical protein